ncbi:pyruvate dehydrogenase E2 component (dihydrolipoamide acetyltransferase) [Fictibacillus solisalsi]|uniref:Dihydrolipoamide acetyltransferase component of pyruvate dehydrogenase complex n=1 Tax=Fictibacillus solisalsi TaxID=459525 RepID=A0A1G9VPY1_9BACL|nr:dihydrolipoamide acetyltransferase family protein [Fictibacillus solisalsi]SDM74196.1 pyruvate dehydrogenase E2 component (dihydrolipoamide acetyltransferase) [Fictibacillus solisalsi]
MAINVVMPKLGMAMKEGTVSVWNKKVGDPVQKGELIASINSEKIEMEIESPGEGILLEIAVEEGKGVPPGTPIAYIGQPDEKVVPGDAQNEAAASIAAEPEAEASVSPQVKEIPSPVRTPGDKVKISPVARKMAAEANLDILTLAGTGPGGRITKEDVQKALESGSQESRPVFPAGRENETKTKADQSFKPLTGMRKVIAERMHSSLQNSAQLTIYMKADITDLKMLQAQSAESVKRRFGEKLTLTDFIARAAILALQAHPLMNSALIDHSIHEKTHVHLGMAVALEKGLVVPVIHDAEKLSLSQLSTSIRELAKKARENQLGSEEMTGSTFTITNLGAYGVEHFTPILNPPEAGILGVGAAEYQPVYRGESLERRSILPLSLTFDHRLVDGAPAAVFLKVIKDYLEEPFSMLV